MLLVEDTVYWEYDFGSRRVQVISEKSQQSSDNLVKCRQLSFYGDGVRGERMSNE